MNHSRRVTSTAHRFGEHRPDMRNTAFRHRGADETPLGEHNFLKRKTPTHLIHNTHPVIALGLTLLVVAALIWCCLSLIFRKRGKRFDHDPEATVENESPCSESAPAFTNIMNAQRDPGSGQNSKFPYHRTRSVTLPHIVYDSQHGVSRSNHGIGSPQCSESQPERNPSLFSLPSLPCPLYRPGDDSLSEQDLQPPPEYSSPSSNPISTQAYTPPTSAMPARFLEVSGIGHETTFSGPSDSLDTSLHWEPAELKKFPPSLSQPTVTGTSSNLNRALSSPDMYTANKTISKSTSYPGITRLYGTYTFFVDPSGRMVIPRLSIPLEQTTASDSIVTISPCDLISTARGSSDTEFLLSHDENRGSCDAIITLASENFASDEIPQPADFDEEPNFTHIHEASQVGTNSTKISA